MIAASPAVGRMLDTLRGRADVVLVDAPALAVSDTIELTGKVDAVVLIARVGAVQNSALEDARRILDSSPVAKIGFVATGVEREAGGYEPLPSARLTERLRDPALAREASTRD